MRLFVSALVLTVLATKAALPACLEMPESVTLKVDSVMVIGFADRGTVEVTVSGFPPGQWRLRCAARDKDGRYLGSAYIRNLQEPASAPAHTITVIVGKGNADQITGADCTAIPFVRGN